jgi:hypothetical protein
LKGLLHKAQILRSRSNGILISLFYFYFLIMRFKCIVTVEDNAKNLEMSIDLCKEAIQMDVSHGMAWCNVFF